MARRRLILIVAGVLLAPFLLLAVLLLVAQSEWAERGLERMASARLDREVQIEDISFRWGWPPGIVFARLRIGNPSWAQTPRLIDAEGLYARVEVLPLFKGLVVIPYLGANRATAGLEIVDERATWRFGERSDDPSPMVLGRVYLEDGDITFLDPAQKTQLRIHAKGSAGEEGMLLAEAEGTFRGENARATARFPGLATQHAEQVRFEGRAQIGKTRAEAKGWIAADAGALDLRLELAGATLRDLNAFTALVLPDTPPYTLQGHLRHEGHEWHFDGFSGKVGDSDLRGGLTFRKPPKGRPFLQAKLESKLLDFDDLGPLIGAPPKTGAGEAAAPHQQASSEARRQAGRILPEREFGTKAWGRMDADVHLQARRIQRPEGLPIQGLETHLVLKDSVLRLEPLNFTVADGRVKANIAMNPRQQPMRGEMKVDVQGLKLRELFPKLESMKDALGTLYGRAELVGHGRSVADLLGTSDGKASLAVDGGRVSLLLVELLGLDVAESVMLLGKRHEQVRLRCAVAGLQVREGVATTEDFVVDTTDTVIEVEGTIDLGKERLDLETKPYPKDPSPVALRTPLFIKGPMRDPEVTPKPGPLAARAAIGAALGAIAPPLALLALIETGPGEDAECGRLLAEARAKGAVKKEK